ISGYQRQDARRQEAGEPGERRHRDRYQQRPVGGDAGERLAHQVGSASRVRITGSSCFWYTAPWKIAASRPLRSTTRVDGIVGGGTWNPSANWPDGSNRLP